MRDLIVFGEDLGGLPSSTQHLITRLAKDRKVVWINSIGLRQPKLSSKDLKRVYDKLIPKRQSKQNRASQRIEHDNIIEVDLLTIPAPQSKLARYIAKDMIISQLKPVIEQANLTNPILWSSLPTTADLCGNLGESAVVYYCGDDFNALAGVDHRTVTNHEKKLVDKADLILTASDSLRLKFPQAKTHLLPHGVDTELFTQPTQRAEDLPTGKPIAGFYGSLSNWIDYPLIEFLAKSMPDWNFVFIGPNELDQLKLPNLDNVFYLGSRAHHMLPSYSQHWDVSMLPFIDNPQIRSCNPLKLMEYMASRQPIVTVNFPSLEPYQQHVHVASTHDEFRQQLYRAAQAPRISRQAVSNQSWSERSQFLNWLLELL